MKINKKEIIDEILSLEPELESERKNLEKILEEFIVSKPDIKMSSTFKDELRHRLISQISYNSNLYKENKYSYLKNFMSFVLGGVATFSILGIVGINFNFTEFGDKNSNQGLILKGSTENNLRSMHDGSSENSTISSMKSMPKGSEIGLMKMESEEEIMENVGMDIQSMRGEESTFEAQDIAMDVQSMMDDEFVAQDESIKISSIMMSEPMMDDTMMKESTEEESNFNEESIEIESSMLKTTMYKEPRLAKSSDNESVSDNEPMEIQSITSEMTAIEENPMYAELESYLKNLGLSKDIIEEILNIIRKYN